MFIVQLSGFKSICVCKCVRITWSTPSCSYCSSCHDSCGNTRISGRSASSGCSSSCGNTRSSGCSSESGHAIYISILIPHTNPVVALKTLSKFKLYKESIVTATSECENVNSSHSNIDIHRKKQNLCSNRVTETE